jgi:hypothetical protein
VLSLSIIRDCQLSLAFAMLLQLHRVVVPIPFFVFVMCASSRPGALKHNIAPFLSHVLHFEIETLPTTRSYGEVRSNA